MTRNEELSTLDVRKDIVSLVRTYCVFNNMKMKDFVSDALEDYLKDFKERLQKMAKIKE